VNPGGGAGGQHGGCGGRPGEIARIGFDTWSGMSYSNAVSLSIIIGIAATLHALGGFVLPRWLRVLGWGTTVLMGGATVGMLVL